MDKKAACYTQAAFTFVAITFTLKERPLYIPQEDFRPHLLSNLQLSENNHFDSNLALH